MPIQQSKKQSDLERRLRIIQSQLYGKESGKQKWQVKSEIVDKEAVDDKAHIIHHSPTSHLSHPTSASDTAYLRRDLTRILIFSSFAIGVQLLLYFALTNNLLKLPL